MIVQEKNVYQKPSNFLQGSWVMLNYVICNKNNDLMLVPLPEYVSFYVCIIILVCLY